MADFNELYGQEGSSLSDLVVAESYPVAPLPAAAVRNRAATTAFLSQDPSKSVENFQSMMIEDQTGQDTTLKALQTSIQQQSTQQDLKGVMNILSDPKISMSQKSAVVKNFQQTNAKKDTANVLAAEAIIAPSAGENSEQEEVRLTTADMMKEINEERQVNQGLTNAAMMSAKGGGLSIIPQAIESMLTPLSQGFSNVAIAKQLPGQNTWINRLQAMVTPGSYISSQREKLENMPPARRKEFTSSLVDAITSNPDLILSKDNQYESIEKLQQYFGDEYTDTDKWVDNVTNLLDVLGIGAAAKSAYKAGKGAATAEQLGERAANFIKGPPKTTPERIEPSLFSGSVQQPSRAPSGVPGTLPLSQMPEARVGASNQALGALEEEYAGLLGQVQSRLEPGDVRSLTQEAATIARQREELKATDIKARTKEIQGETRGTRKEAEAQARKELKDREVELDGRQAAVDERLRINADTAEAEKRLKSLEEQMAKLRKDTSTEPAKLNPIADSIQRIQLNSVARTHNPASPGAILMQTNPEKARGAFSAVVNSNGDEVAGALFGTTRQDAIADSILPKVSTASGRVTTSPGDMERTLRNDMIGSIEDIIADSGGIQFTPREIATARANIVNDFENASGLHINDSMSSFGTDGARIEVSAVYGTTEGGFLNAEDAAEQAMYALRGYGIQPNEITILAKEGLDHVPVKLDDVRGVPGNYLVQVKTMQNIENLAEGSYEALDVKRNILDRIARITPDSWGSLQRWVVDAASMLHSTITGSAINAVDRSSLLGKTMLRYADAFSNAYTKLPKDRQTKMFDHIKEANFKSIKYDTVDLMGRGFNADEINILGDWKKFWDGHYYLENLDVVRTLRRDGYQKFDNGTDELFAKPSAKNINNSFAYDPATQTVRKLSQQELDDLYNKGGYLGKLRRPTSLAGETTEYMVVENRGKNSLRALRDNDTALNYRDGYFQLTYKAPMFVEEVVRGANGNIEYTRAIAVAGDRKQAEQFAKRQQAGSPNTEYRVRGDDRQIAQSGDAMWDVSAASGRIAQRHRGKLLEDAAGMNHLGDQNFVDNPVNSAIRAAQSISGRTVMRPVIDTAKNRFLQQYKDVLPTNEFGLTRMPKNSGEIKSKGVSGSKELADARTTFEYIKYLEDGYVNAADSYIKATIHALSEGLGRTGFAKTEAAINRGMEGVNPSTALKGAVFSAYIAANPLRQWIVQTHQVIRSIAYNPVGWGSGETTRYAAGYLGKFVPGYIQSKEVKEFSSFLDGTGLLTAIDKNNLVRGTLLDAADRNTLITRPYNMTIGALRRIGFDVGEAGNLVGHAASVYEKYKRSGADVLSSEVRAKMHSEIRALTWDMNFAGDMPYNQNWAAMALQFMQVPHKAVLQMTNRRMDAATRMRMVTADMVMWGAPLGITASLLPDDILPNDPVLRETIVSGLESALLNKFFRSVADDKTSVDFSSLAPYDMSGWGDFFKAAWSGGGISEILANAPAGQLLFKDGGRLSNAVQLTMRAFTPTSDSLDTGDKIMDAIDAIGRISSGWNNYQKGRAMLVIGQARDGVGRMTDEQTTKIEAFAQMLGFGTSDTKQFYETSMKLSAGSKAHKDQAVKDAKEILRMYQSLNPQDPNDFKRAVAVSDVILKSHQADPAAQAIMQREISSALAKPSDTTMMKILSATNLPNVAELPDIIRQAPIDDSRKEMLMKIVKDVQGVRNTDYYKEK